MLSSCGYYDKAMIIVNETKDILLEAKAMGLKKFLLEIEAFIAIGENDLARFDDKFGKMVKLAALTQVNGMMPNHKWIKLLLKTTLERDAGTDYAREMIRLYELTPGDKIYENWPYPLKIYTLGRFEIEKNSKIMKFSGKVQKTPLSMLKLIVALGGRNVTVETISDALWPDADGDTAKISFNTTLHRLRKMIGEDDNIIIVSNGVVSLNPELCWSDVWAFEYFSDKIDELYKENIAGGGVNLGYFKEAWSTLVKVFNLYKGNFLSTSADLPQSLWLQESIKSRYFKLLLNMGYWCQNLGIWENAITCYNEGIRIDPYDEMFYQNLMQCYIHLEYYTKAIQTYELCCKLIKGMGIEPSEKTKSIIRAINKS